MRKLLWFAVGFALAVGLCNALLPVNVFLLASGVSAALLSICLFCMLRFPKFRIGAMVSFAATIGFLWCLGYDAMYLAPVRGYDGQTVTLTLTATDTSYETNYGAATEGRVELDGKTYSILLYHDNEISLSPGDRITGEMNLRCTLVGGKQDSLYNRSNRVFLTARTNGEMTVTPCEHFNWADYPAVIRQRILSAIRAAFPEDTAAFACALLLGETDGIDYETDTSFKVSGIRHIIAVSGLHVTILFSLVFVLTGHRKWITAILGIPVLFFFAAVAGFSPSITRACIMHSLMVIAMLFNKEYDPLTALAFAVICMLGCNPFVIANVGFQLSVSCMLGIILFADRIKNYLMDKKRFGRWKGFWKKMAGWFAASVSVSLSAMILTTPLCAYYFGVVSLIGPLTNLLTLWVITFVFYGIMLSCILGAILPIAGTVVAWIVSWTIRYVLWIAKSMASIPLAAVYTQSVYVVCWLIFAYILLVIFLLSKKKRPILLGCCATLALCVSLVLSWTEPMLDDVRVTVLDVGQGQCVLLQSDGRNYLVDCGSYSDSFAADQAAGLLLSQGIAKLDGIILTHFDNDHIGGVANLLTRISVSQIYVPKRQNDEEHDDFGMAEVITVETELVFSYGDSKITLIPSENATSSNESGLCILFQTENCDTLITGDRTAAGERELLRQIELPELEVLVVGHHGSKTSTSLELLYKTNPKVAIISVGADNPYGHPTDLVLSRLRTIGCIIYRTDLQGTIIYRG